MSAQRIVIVTGGGRGIGAATCRLAAAAGYAVAVNFLADLDVTGGNSGSATLNSRGELVGL